MLCSAALAPLLFSPLTLLFYTVLLSRNTTPFLPPTQYAFIEFVNVEDAKAAQEGETGRRLSNGRFLITMPAKARQNAKGGAGARR